MTCSTSDVAVCCSSDSGGRGARARSKQPRVLDGDHGLVGEGRHQLDFALRKWVHSGAGEANDADRFALAHQRHANHRTTA